MKRHLCLLATLVAVLFLGLAPRPAVAAAPWNCKPTPCDELTMYAGQHFGLSPYLQNNETLKIHASKSALTTLWFVALAPFTLNGEKATLVQPQWADGRDRWEVRRTLWIDGKPKNYHVRDATTPVFIGDVSFSKPDDGSFITFYAFIAPT